MNRLSRFETVAEAKRLHDEIIQIFFDQQYWNQNVRKPDEEPINVDADGKLAGMLKALEHFLRKEENK